jgi:GT2 family glycosyltransferase
LKAEFPQVDLIQLDVNQGFSGGANRGIERALALGAEYVHVIGNDTTLAPTAIRHLVTECEQRTDVGAASPLLLDPGEPPIVQFYRATIDREVAIHMHHHMGEPYREGEWPVTESEFIPCNALMFRARALEEVGLLDETFGTCWEDYDLCLRLHEAGWKYITVGHTTAAHIGSYTTGRSSPYITYYTVRNRLVCLRRYSPPDVWRRRGLDLLKSFRLQVRGYGWTNWACHKALLQGIWDFLRHVEGERRSNKPTRIPGQS